jgi:transcriptional regulatory protein RtcR
MLSLDNTNNHIDNINNHMVTNKSIIIFSIVNPEDWGTAHTVQMDMLGAIVRDSPLVRRMELLVPKNGENAAERLKGAIREANPTIEISQRDVDFSQGGYAGTYQHLFEWLDSFEFNREKEEYLIDITGGPSIAKAFLLNMAKDWVFPIKPIFKKSRSSLKSYEVADIGEIHHMAMTAAIEPRHQEGRSGLANALTTLDEDDELIVKLTEISERSRDPILLMGPTGVGKTQLAAKIFEIKEKLGNQFLGDYIPVNCATLQGDAAMSMLFGHMKGAFTGAISNTQGYLKAADNGLLFLDEIGELSQSAQAMLLTAIENKKFHPLGSTKLVSSNFQLVAGTNRDLFADVETGKFRADLLARISTWTFILPPITEMRHLFEKFVGEALSKFKKDTGHGAEFNSAAKEAFLKFATSPAAIWPGNFRDLNTSVHRMATMAKNGTIEQEQVEEELFELNRRWGRDEKKANTLSSNLAEKRLNYYLAILENIYPNEFKTWEFPVRRQKANMLEACDNSKDGANAYRLLFKTGGLASINDSQKMKRIIAKQLPRYSFPTLKAKIADVKEILTAEQVTPPPSPVA